MSDCGESVPVFERKVRGRKEAVSEEQMAVILRAVDRHIDERLKPIKKAIDLIMKRLDIKQLPLLAETPSTGPNNPQPKEDSDASMDDLDLDDQLSLDSPINLPSKPVQTKPQQFQFSDLLKISGRPSPTCNKLTEDKVPQPQGNNTTYNPATLPPDPPMEGILPEHRQPWSSLYHKVRNLILSKRKRGERGWFDYQKRILLQFVTTGAKYGCNPYDLTMQLGVSHSTFKRWRNYFK